MSLSLREIGGDRCTDDSEDLLTHHSNGAIARRRFSVARNPQALEELVELVRRVSNNTEYPIRNFGQIARALGGEDAEITYRGRGHRVSEARQFISQEFFPINSEEELVAKAHGVEQRSGLGEPTDVEWGEEEDRPPDDAGRPSDDIRPRPAPGSSEVPHLEGHGRRRP